MALPLADLDEEQLDRLLDREPRNIHALVRKGDLCGSRGDDRGATAFYKAALSAAAQLAQQGPLSADLRPPIEKAQSGIAVAERRFHDHLERSLSVAGFPAGHRPAAFQRSLDVLLGRAQVSLQLQRPTTYYFPDLPQRRYFDPSEFAWRGAVEEAAEAIRGELQAYLNTGRDDFSPYVVSDPTRPRNDVHGLRDNPAWSTLYLWEKGRAVPGIADLFPATMAAMEQVDLARISVRAPSILFSRLKPGARIPPHHGAMNARLICHLPLIVPPNCGFRVGGETRLWEEGKLLIFDDTVEHEAWNDSREDRIILIFDCWRPEIGPEDRRAIATMFEAIDAY